MANILLVDDVAVVRLVLRTMLERAGHTVVEAADGLDGAAKAGAAPFDVVITDIGMPQGDGLAFIGRIKQARPGTRVLAMSGGAPRQSGELSLREAAAAGADAVLLKPVDKAELLGALARLLSR